MGNFDLGFWGLGIIILLLRAIFCGEQKTWGFDWGRNQKYLRNKKPSPRRGKSQVESLPGCLEAEEQIPSLAI